MKRFDVFNSKQESAPTNIVPTTETSPPAPATNGASVSPKTKAQTNGKKRSSPTPNDDDDDALSSVADSPPPPKKQKKIEQSQAESDAEYAKRLQAELNRIGARSTRGGGATTKRKPAAKQQRKKKSKARVGSDDDSDAEGGEKKEVKRTGGFHVCLSTVPRIQSLALTYTETYGSLFAARGARQRNPALAPADRQEDLGVHQGERLARPE